MKTISIETTKSVTRITIGPDGLQSRRLSKNPDEPELKKHYEEERSETRVEIERDLREEHGNTLSEEEIQEYIADQMQPMDSSEEDLYYGRSGISFIDMSLHDVTNVEIQVSRNKTEKHETQIRLMLLGGPYGPLCILEDSVNNMTDQNVLREGIALILNTIAVAPALPYETSLSAHMKTALDKLDADLTTTIRTGGSEFIFHPDHLTVKSPDSVESATYPRNKLYSHRTTFATKPDGSCHRKISLCVFPPANSIALKTIDIFQGTFDTSEDPPGFSDLLDTIVAYLPEKKLIETTAQESSESSRSSPI